VQDSTLQVGQVTLAVGGNAPPNGHCSKNALFETPKGEIWSAMLNDAFSHVYAFSVLQCTLGVDFTKLFRQRKDACVQYSAKKLRFDFGSKVKG
jgi:hypothetical protein